MNKEPRKDGPMEDKDIVISSRANFETVIEDNARLREQIEQLEKECNEAWLLKKQAVEECNKAVKERDEAYRKDEIKMREYNLLVQENRALSAKCAEMRAALLVVDDWDDKPLGMPTQRMLEIVRHTLSSDCGKGFVHVSELERWVRQRLAGVIPDTKLQEFINHAVESFKIV